MSHIQRAYPARVGFTRWSNGHPDHHPAAMWISGAAFIATLLLSGCTSKTPLGRVADSLPSTFGMFWYSSDAREGPIALPRVTYRGSPLGAFLAATGQYRPDEFPASVEGDLVIIHLPVDAQISTISLYAEESPGGLEVVTIDRGPGSLAPGPKSGTYLLRLPHLEKGKLYGLAHIGLTGGEFYFFAEASRPREKPKKPPPAVTVKTVVERLIGVNTVQDVSIDESTGTVTVVFKSATYPPAARATMAGRIAAPGLVTRGSRVREGTPVAFVVKNGSSVVVARADWTGRIEEVLVKQGDEVRERQAVATVVPDDKEEARHNLETEGMLASQLILMELPNVTSVVSKIMYREVTLATVVGKRGETSVTTRFHEDLR